MSLGWIAYLPLPGLALVPALVERYSRNARFHAWQGGALVVLLWVVLILLGLLARISGGEAMEAIIGTVTLLVMIAYLVGAITGAIAAGRDRYIRVRPVYELVALIKRR